MNNKKRKLFIKQREVLQKALCFEEIQSAASENVVRRALKLCRCNFETNNQMLAK